MDTNSKVSFLYALRYKREDFYKSKTESTSFPDLHQTYNTVPLERK
jgi:hypothetical protein